MQCVKRESALAWHWALQIPRMTQAPMHSYMPSPMPNLRIRPSDHWQRVHRRGSYHHQRYHDRQHRENQQKYHIRHAKQTRPDTIESTLLYYGFPAHRHHSLEANMREAITYEIPYATTVVVNTAITSHNRCAMMAFAAWANPLVTEAGKIDSSMDTANTTT